MQPLPPSELGDSRDDLPGHEVTLKCMVSGYLFYHPEQKRDLVISLITPFRDLTECGLANEAQADAGDAGKRQRKALAGQGRDG